MTFATYYRKSWAEPKGFAVPDIEPSAGQTDALFERMEEIADFVWLRSDSSAKAKRAYEDAIGIMNVAAADLEDLFNAIDPIMAIATYCADADMENTARAMIQKALNEVIQ